MDDRDRIMQELGKHLQLVFEQSPDGVYVWLDETHKLCNQRLAEMFGYTVDEWQDQEPFLDSFIAEEDQPVYSWNYYNRVAALSFPVTFRFKGVRRDGSTFNAETDLVPLSWEGYPLAYHFVRRVL